MLKPKAILCPIDFSEFSLRAYCYAQSLADHYKANLILQHVLYALPPFYSDPAYRETCRMVRNDALRKLVEFAKVHNRTKVQPQCAVHEGIETDQILKFAKAQKANLIVMGSHGLCGLDRLMLGSVIERVLRKSKCPVLTVRKSARDCAASRKMNDPVTLKKILLCMDFSRHAQRGLRLGLSLAKEYRAEITLLHVLEHVPGSADLEKVTANVLNKLQASVSAEEGMGLRPKFAVHFGKPFRQIVEHTLEAQTDLVIVGVRGHGSLDSALFGSTAYRVIQQCPSPVLAVHV